jgi:dihydropteroate synthase
MFKIPVQNGIWEIDAPQVMGILNVTSDSFYAGSRAKSVESAVKKVNQFITEGATIIDIGGQSTRPGAKLLSIQEEIENVVPIVEGIRNQHPNILLSIDTFHSQVAAAALKGGANIINDISCGSFDQQMLQTVAAFNAGYIGMHIRGTFETMHQVPERAFIMEELLAYFKEKIKTLAEFGIKNWVIDPGFGFGKTIEENFKVVKELDALKCLELPILLGVSRKSSIYKTLNITAEEALNGTTIVNTIGILNGASILRVHDVKEARQIIDLHPYLSK